jgi:hypothetical protein
MRQKKRGDWLIAQFEAGNPEVVESIQKRMEDGVTEEDIRRWYNTPDFKVERIERDLLLTKRLLFASENERTGDENAAIDYAQRAVPFLGAPDEPDGIHEGEDRPLRCELINRIYDWVRQQGLDPKDPRAWMTLRLRPDYPTVNSLIRAEMRAGRL